MVEMGIFSVFAISYFVKLDKLLPHITTMFFGFAHSMSKGVWPICYLIHSKKCWVKCNPLLGKYWTEHMLGCFQPTVGSNG